MTTPSTSSKQSTTKANQDKNIRSAILTQAHDLFYDKGYNLTTLAEILKAAQTKTKNIEAYYPGGKEELAQATLEARGRQLQSDCKATYNSQPNPKQALAQSWRENLELAPTWYRHGDRIRRLAAELAIHLDQPLHQVTAFHSNYFYWLRDTLSDMNIENAEEIATDHYMRLLGAVELSRSLGKIDILTNEIEKIRQEIHQL